MQSIAVLRMGLRDLILPLILLAAPLNGPVRGETPLQSLETGFAARGWEAVGRLDLAGRGFCTATLIEDRLVLTAAHCLFDKTTGQQYNLADLSFDAGWRRGRALASREIRRAAVPLRYNFSPSVSALQLRNDVALLELAQPIAHQSIRPFRVTTAPETGAKVAVVSYASNREDAPSLEERCDVLNWDEGVLFTSCSVDPGASGAPIFVVEGGQARIAALVSAKAAYEGEDIALGLALETAVRDLRRQLNEAVSLRSGTARRDIGAKFLRPDS